MSRRMAVTLSCGDNGALGPPISVLTHPGLSKTQMMPRGAKSIAALRITHIHGCLGEPPDVLSASEPIPLVMVTTSLRTLRAM